MKKQYIEPSIKVVEIESKNILNTPTSLERGFSGEIDEPEEEELFGLTGLFGE